MRSKEIPIGHPEPMDGGSRDLPNNMQNKSQCESQKKPHMISYL